MVGLAASGNLEAQTILRDGLMAECNAPERTLSHFELLVKAEVFARLAAAHGGAMDRLYLGAVLLIRADQCRAEGDAELADAFQFEAFTEFDTLVAMGNTDALAILVNGVSINADAGNEFAALILQRVIANLTPQDAAAIAATVHNLEMEA